MVELYYPVRNMIKKHRPLDEFIGTSILYNAPNDEHLVACFAVYYRHDDLIKCRSSYTTEYTMLYNPLLTAVYTGAHDLIPVLISRIRVEDIAYWEGSGKIEYDYAIAKVATIWEAIFEMDDPVSLELLRKCCFSTPEALWRLAATYKAYKCIKVLDNTREQISPSPFTTGSSELDDLSIILERACSSQGITTTSMRLDAILAWTAISPAERSKYLRDEDQGTITRVLAGDWRQLHQYCESAYIASTCVNNDGEASGSYTDLDLHSRVIIGTWTFCINTQSRPTQTLMHRLQQKLTQRVVDVVHASKRMDWVDSSTQRKVFARAMFLLNMLTKILLKSGGNMEVIKFDIVWKLIELADRSPLPVSINCMIYQHLEILITYCYRLLHFERWSAQDWWRLRADIDCVYFIRMIRTLISLMRHEAYEVYVRFIKNMERFFEEKLRTMLPESKEAKRFRLHLAHTISRRVSTPRLLQELCRMKLYQTIPSKLPDVVDMLMVPDLLKDWLTMGVSSMPS